MEVIHRRQFLFALVRIISDNAMFGMKTYELVSLGISIQEEFSYFNMEVAIFLKYIFPDPSQTFQRIRTNRQGRLRAKTRKRKGDSESEFTEHIRNAQCQSCPVCHGRLQRTPEEIAQHVEDCIRKVRNVRNSLNMFNVSKIIQL